VISPSQGRYLTQTQNKRTQTSMPRVGFEPTIPAFERTKTVHALDRAATVIGRRLITDTRFEPVARLVKEFIASNGTRRSHCYSHNSQIPDAIPSKTNPVHSLIRISDFSTLQLNIINPSMSVCLSVCLSQISRLQCYMSSE
jgi:hypothetical protein